MHFSPFSASGFSFYSGKQAQAENEIGLPNNLRSLSGLAFFCEKKCEKMFF
jgi:hypothetical protein